jgi:hypothetical protein
LGRRCCPGTGEVEAVDGSKPADSGWQAAAQSSCDSGVLDNPLHFSPSKEWSICQMGPNEYLVDTDPVTNNFGSLAD